MYGVRCMFAHVYHKYVVLCLYFCLQKNYKPNEVVVKNPPTDKKPDNPIEDEDDDSSFYINAPEELRRAYINVELKTNQKPQKQVSYYSVEE